MRTPVYSLPWLKLTTIAMLVLMSVGSVTASPKSQTPTTPTPQPTKPILLTDPVPDPRQEGVRWFAPTGHTLRGEFLDYWTRYGGLEQFGYPLTEEFFESVGADNRQYRVQYFERNRFEHHPENAGTQYEVLLGVLGRDFRQQDPPAAPLSAPAVYFNETGHNLSGVFKEYWDTHGGLFVHGYPITEAVMERSTDGKEYLVQWFERSRFELHPENAGTQYEVLLGLLGRQLSEKKGYPAGAYPRYGSAPDFSWVAAEVEMYSPGTYCQATECGCVLARTDAHHGVVMQMIQIDDLMFPARLDIRSEELVLNDSIAYVFFGRRTVPEEKHVICLLLPAAPGYLVKHAQRNPVP